MGIEFEELKKKILIDRPILVKQCRVRGNKNIFRVGPGSSAIQVPKKNAVAAATGCIRSWAVILLSLVAQ